MKAASLCAECNGEDDHEALLDFEAPPPTELMEQHAGEFGFVRATLQIPVRGTKAFLRYGVWVLVDLEDDEQILEADEEDEGTEISGLLATDEPYGSVDHELMLTLGKPGERPAVALDSSDNRLFEDQQRGIDFFTLHFYRRRLGLEKARNTAAQWPLRCGRSHPDWPHPIPPSSGVFTALDVAERGKPARQIAHTPTGLEVVAGRTDPRDTTYICLACLIDRNPTLVKLVEPPLGYQATRKRPGDPWVVKEDRYQGGPR